MTTWQSDSDSERNVFADDQPAETDGNMPSDESVDNSGEISVFQPVNKPSRALSEQLDRAFEAPKSASNEVIPMAPAPMNGADNEQAPSIDEPVYASKPEPAEPEVDAIDAHDAEPLEASDDTSHERDAERAVASPADDTMNTPDAQNAASDEPLSAPAVQRRPQSPPKPRVCLMGEFSAGKSTLSNFLIGGSALPVNVTATQLPPVWISHGDDIPYRVDLDGGEYDIDFNKLGDISVDDTSHIRIFSQAELLKTCDLIDMPGISDPNMAPEVWQRVVHHADAVIWCTHATQAWRQSEAAVWSMMTPSLYQKSFLLLTRMDKIQSDRDRMRVIRRVGRETDGLFRELFPVSLLQALHANGDPEMLQESGADAFQSALNDLLEELNGDAASATTAEAHNALLNADGAMPERNVVPRRVTARKLTARKLVRRTSTTRPTGDTAGL